MKGVSRIDCVTSFGMNKVAFRDVYSTLKPEASDADFDLAWQKYSEAKAEHIRQLNARDKTP